MRRVIRYHPILVTLHWVLALLIVAALALGLLVLADMPNSDPQKIGILEVHMAGGMLILALMAVRLVVRLRTATPPVAESGYPLLDRLASIIHYGFYVLVASMAGTGLATAILAGLNRIVFQNSGEPLPSSFEVFPTFVAHFYVAMVLIGFLGLHVLAALYHQFIRNDRLFRRMSFGQRGAHALTESE